MGRIAFWLLLAAAAYLAVVFMRRSRKERVQEDEDDENQPRKEGRYTIPMVRCPVCGTNFPKDEAVLGDGVRYCSEKCRTSARMKNARRGE